MPFRYHQPLSKLPADGAEFTLQHALDCRKGGLIIQQHNEVRDALGDLASIAFRDVIRETNCKRSCETSSGLGS